MKILTLHKHVVQKIQQHNNK